MQSNLGYIHNGLLKKGVVIRTILIALLFGVMIAKIMHHIIPDVYTSGLRTLSGIIQ